MSLRQPQLAFSQPWRNSGSAKQLNKDDRQFKAPVEQIALLCGLTSL
jgi:hypothetical protein